MSLVATYTYEEGAEGSIVQAAGAPGGQGSPGVTTVSGAPVYDISSAIHGSLGINSPSSRGGGQLSYINPLPANATGSIYVQVNSKGSSPVNLVTFTRASGAALAGISLKTAGVIAVVDGSGTVKASTATAKWTRSTPFRVDWQQTYKSSKVGISLKVYTTTADGATPDEIVAAVSFAAAVSPDKITVGSSASDWDISFDTLRLYNDNSAWPPPYQPAPVLPTQIFSWVGDPLNDGFVITSSVQLCTSVRLVVSTSSTMTSPIYFGPSVPDSLGYVRHVATGLRANTRYYYQLADTPTGGTEALFGGINRTRTAPAAGSPQNMTIALGSCTVSNSDISAALDDIRTNFDPHFVIHLGDFHYKGITSTDYSLHVKGYSSQILGAAGLQQLCATVPMYYTISDHEYSGNNGDDGAATAANLTAFREMVPYRTLVNPAIGRYRSWVVGRIRFIMMDIRSQDRSPAENADGPSKTMLGTAQKQWVKDQLQMTEPVKVLISDTAWLGGQPGDDGYGDYNGSDNVKYWDKWCNYATERQELADFITQNKTTDGQPIRVDLWHGDSHFVGAAMGTDNPNGKNNIWGGFPVLCGSPFDQHGIGNFQDYYDSVFNNGGDSAAGAGPKCSQYMRVSITDDGTTITRVAEGFGFTSDPSDPENKILSGSGAVRISQTYSWNTSTDERSGHVKVWDGSKWSGHPFKVWDGSKWTQHPFKGYDGTKWINGK